MPRAYLALAIRAITGVSVGHHFPPTSTLKRLTSGMGVRLIQNARIPPAQAPDQERSTRLNFAPDSGATLAPGPELAEATPACFPAGIKPSRLPRPDGLPGAPGCFATITHDPLLHYRLMLSSGGFSFSSPKSERLSGFNRRDLLSIAALAGQGRKLLGRPPGLGGGRTEALPGMLHCPALGADGGQVSAGVWGHAHNPSLHYRVMQAQGKS